MEAPDKAIEQANEIASQSIQKTLSLEINNKTKVDIIREICGKALKDEQAIIHAQAWC